MTAATTDAFVFFGATGDLAYKKVFPALQALVRSGDLDMPAGTVLDRQAAPAARRSDRAGIRRRMHDGQF